ncbi:hypothetical protein [Brevundimonas sp.]|uniref:hypothetical protein n=1 Tax=Brevundimonas sp. TaxID=1871086 RepID=UPI001DC63496|nr:hypothetical protein [Brevundimonas sp.]MBA3999068.1 hypothetical protein [Brevundimonas sp.]
MSLRSSRLFKRAVLAIYWVALPICLLAFVASFTAMSPDGAYQPSLGTALVSAALAGLIGWRLWLIARSMGHVGELPSPRRWIIVVIPLALLSLVGLAVMLLGLVWTGLGLWLALEPGALEGALIYPDGVLDSRWAGALTAGSGLIALIGGAALNIPLLRLLPRRRSETPSPADAAALDTMP